jgi:hypothetical protein
VVTFARLLEEASMRTKNFLHAWSEAGHKNVRTPTIFVLVHYVKARGPACSLEINTNC